MHLLESSYIPLELYFEHRNYMSMIGPIMASVWYLNVLLERSMLAIGGELKFHCLPLCWFLWFGRFGRLGRTPVCGVVGGI